jgi:carbon-monoxide dehydrogenase medium subunit
MWKQYYTVSSIDDALDILDSEHEEAKIIAGGTDLVLEIKNDQHPYVKTLIDITRIKDQDNVWIDDGYVNIGPLLTHNQCLVSEELIKFGFPLVRAAYSIGAPQIRNIGTVVGNLVTASPANDTITPLVALDAEIIIRSKIKEYAVKLIDFYTGVRKTIMAPNEMVVGLRFPKMKPNQRGAFIKYLLRETHAISVANVCVILTLDGSDIQEAIVTLGAVAPTIIHSQKAEMYLSGKELSKESIERSAKLAQQDALPIDDIRSSEKYRSHLIPILLKKALSSIKDGSWNTFDFPPILLWGKKTKFIIPIEKSIKHDISTPLEITINGSNKTFDHGQNGTLLALIRDTARLTGTKEGCGEGECGACTLHLNGLPVFSCLLPAPKAHGNDIKTIEGLATDNKLHPVQEAFVEAGAVQCGYCTPGFIMSAVKLLEEKPNPTEMDIKQGLSGNICRCTGYYSIIEAVEKASHKIEDHA